jgi:hypothetical protein
MQDRTHPVYPLARTLAGAAFRVAAIHASACIFRYIECGITAPEQAFRCLTITRRKRSAYCRRYSDGSVAAQIVGLRDRSDNPIGNAGSLLSGHLDQHDCELVTTKAIDDIVLAQTGLKPIRNQAEKIVAITAAILLIDGFKAVNINA